MYSFFLCRLQVVPVKEEVDSAGRSALFRASSAGQITLVESLIKSGMLPVTIVDLFLTYLFSE